MSGSSSTSVLNAENRPKITSATIITTVTMGRLIAKSEMNIVKPLATAVWRGVGLSALIRRRWLHAYRCTWRDALGSRNQQRVTNCDSVCDLHGLARRIAHPERDVDACNLATLYLDDRGTLHARIDRRKRNDDSFLRPAGDAAIRIESRDERVAGVRNRYDDLYLTGRRVDGRAHARHLTVKFLTEISGHCERHVGANAKHRQLIRGNRCDEPHRRRIDDGEQCTARLHYIPGTHTFLTHDAVERGGDPRVIEILLRGCEAGLCIFECGLRARRLSLSSLEIPLRDRTGLQQRLAALQIALRNSSRCFGRRNGRLGAQICVLQTGRVDAAE